MVSLQRHIRRARAGCVLALCMLPGTFSMPARAQMLTGYGAPQTVEQPATVVTAGHPDDEYAYRPYTGPKLTMFAGDEPAAAPAPVPAYPPAPEPIPAPATGDKAPVDLTADTLEHDDKTGEVTASGHVELEQSGRILHADRVSYNLNTGTVTASGHVVLNEPNGDVHFADNVELSNDMRDGFVDGLRSYLSNGGRFRAKNGTREHSTLLTMHEASYTPCDCETDEDGDPVWQIRAERVTYDEEAHKVSYKNPRFELFGVPVLWSPYLSHSDGKEKRKSGLLTPDLGYDSALGFIVAENYYWNIAPNQDATIGMMLTTQENPVGLVEYRRRWTQADLQANGSFTRSGRTDSVAGQDVALKDEWRGHLFADGRWDMSDTWRSGLKLELTSDDQYLRQYDFSSKDVLENEIYAERFSGRNYAAIRGLAFQDVRVREDQTDQPSVLPEAELRFVGTPNATLGGRWSVDASALGLVRDGSGQDVARGVLQAGWQRRATTSWGLVNTLDLSMRGDAYSVSDRDIATGATGRSSDGTQTRLFPQAQLVSSLPLVRPTARGQILVEPIAGLTVAPNINADDGDIPNEDSQDVQIDATNLFEASRFPGLDRIEDRSRVTYGLRTGIYGNQGNRLTAFLGQSHNLDSDDNPFPEGSGLERQDSDVVGSLSALYDEHFTANYRFQLSSDDLSSQRHEADIYAGWRRLGLGARYLFAKGLAGTNIDESREQAEGSVSYFLTEHWRTRVGALYDLGEDPGLRKAVMGVDFFGCCLSLSATAERNLTTDSSGDSGTDIMLRLGLKGLGEFEQVKTDRWGVLGSSRP